MMMMMYGCISFNDNHVVIIFYYWEILNDRNGIINMLNCCCLYFSLWDSSNTRESICDELLIFSCECCCERWRWKMFQLWSGHHHQLWIWKCEAQSNRNICLWFQHSHYISINSLPYPITELFDNHMTHTEVVHITSKIHPHIAYNYIIVSNAGSI